MARLFAWPLRDATVESSSGAGLATGVQSEAYADLAVVHQEWKESGPGRRRRVMRPGNLRGGIGAWRLEVRGATPVRMQSPVSGEVMRTRGLRRSARLAAVDMRVAGAAPVAAG
ncbi:unnamed protein product [Urochloa humidicola]